MGVPILRGGRVLGVLVVQNRTLRHYTEDEIETLQTIAMIVAELVASGELVNPLEMAAKPQRRAAAGAARRHPAQCRPGDRPGGAARAAHRHPPGRRRGCRRRARAPAPARSRAMQERDRPSWSTPADGLGAGEHRDILETYRMFAADRGWLAAHHRGGAQRPHRRSGGAEGAGRDPQPHDRRRPIPICASGSPISKTSPTGCSSISPASVRRHRRRRAAGRIHPRRAQHGAGRAAGLRPHAAQGAGARGRLAHRACRDRRPRARHSRGRPGRRGDAGRIEAGDLVDRRRRGWHGADPAERGRPAGGRRPRSPPAPRAPRLLRDAARPAGRDPRRRRGQAAAQCRPAARPAASRRDRRRRHRAVPHRDCTT